MAVSGDEMQVMLGLLLGLDDFGIGEQQRTLVKCRLLAAIEQFGRTQHVGIVAAFQRVAQDQMAELRDKNRRQIAGAAPGKADVDRLERWCRDQPVAKIHHKGPVLARIGISEDCDIGLRDRAKRIGQQARVQITLGLAGLVRRHQFGTRQIGHDQFGRRDQTSVIGAARQMMAGGYPEFSHLRFPLTWSVPINPNRSTSSAGSSSPSIS